MLKFSETDIVFREFPNEVTLAINLTNCPHRCKGCHSPHLQTDCGTELTESVLESIIDKYKNSITCVGFMGGDSDLESLHRLVKFVACRFPTIKLGWYTGNICFVDSDLERLFDYIKLGPYIEELGPLDKSTTNQKLYKNAGILSDGSVNWEWIPMFKK